MSRNTNVKRLNTKGGANQHKFQGLHERLNNIHINLSSLSIIHDSEFDVIQLSVSQSNKQSNAQLSGANQSVTQSADKSSSIELINQSRSHFHDQLMIQRELHGFELFNLAFAELRPISQSFPLIVHNRKKLVLILLHYIEQSINPTTDDIMTYHQYSKLQQQNDPSIHQSRKQSQDQSGNQTITPFLLLLTSLAKDLRSELTPFFPIILASLLSIINPTDSDSL